MEGPRIVAAKPNTILVVDDSDDHRFITLTELSRLSVPGLRIEQADGAEAALTRIPRILSESGGLLILADYRMPRMGGIELLQAVRHRHPKAPIRFVVYSSTDAGVSDESLRNGADEFIIKPMELNEFRQTLRHLIDGWLPGKAVRRAI